MRTLLKSTTHPDSRHVHVETGDPEGEVWINVCHDDHTTAAGAHVRVDQLLDALDAVPKSSPYAELAEQCGRLAQEHRAAIERAERAEAKLAASAHEASDELTNDQVIDVLYTLAGLAERRELPVKRVRRDPKTGQILISEWLRAVAACLPADKNDNPADKEA